MITTSTSTSSLNNQTNSINISVDSSSYQKSTIGHYEQQHPRKGSNPHLLSSSPSSVFSNHSLMAPPPTASPSFYRPQSPASASFSSSSSSSTSSVSSSPITSASSYSSAPNNQQVPSGSNHHKSTPSRNRPAPINIAKANNEQVTASAASPRAAIVAGLRSATDRRYQQRAQQAQQQMLHQQLQNLSLTNNISNGLTGSFYKSSNGSNVSLNSLVGASLPTNNGSSTMATTPTSNTQMSFGSPSTVTAMNSIPQPPSAPFQNSNYYSISRSGSPVLFEPPYTSHVSPPASPAPPDRYIAALQQKNQELMAATRMIAQQQQRIQAAMVQAASGTTGIGSPSNGNGFGDSYQSYQFPGSTSSPRSSKSQLAAIASQQQQYLQQQYGNNNLNASSGGMVYNNTAGDLGLLPPPLIHSPYYAPPENSANSGHSSFSSISSLNNLVYYDRPSSPSIPVRPSSSASLRGNHSSVSSIGSAASASSFIPSSSLTSNVNLQVPSAAQMSYNSSNSYNDKATGSPSFQRNHRKASSLSGSIASNNAKTSYVNNNAYQQSPLNNSSGTYSPYNKGGVPESHSSSSLHMPSAPSKPNFIRSSSPSHVSRNSNGGSIFIPSGLAIGSGVISGSRAKIDNYDVPVRQPIGPPPIEELINNSSINFQAFS